MKRVIDSTNALIEHERSVERTIASHQLASVQEDAAKERQRHAREVDQVRTEAEQEEVSLRRRNNAEQFAEYQRGVAEGEAKVAWAYGSIERLSDRIDFMAKTLAAEVGRIEANFDRHTEYVRHRHRLSPAFKVILLAAVIVFALAGGALADYFWIG